MQQYTDALEFYMDIISPNNADKSFVVPAWAVDFAERYAEHRATPPPSSRQVDDKLKKEALLSSDKWVEYQTTGGVGSEQETILLRGYREGYIAAAKKYSQPAPPTNQGDFSHLGPEAEGIINAVYEGAELWKQEYDDCRRLLQDLVTLKKIKDTDGKTDFYLKRQPELWAAAELFLSTYQHNIS